MSGFATEIAIEFAQALMAATPKLYKLWMESSQNSDAFIKTLDSALEIARERTNEALRRKHGHG